MFECIECHRLKSCTHDPMTMLGKPIGMYHCPECGEMVIAGVPHMSKCLDCCLEGLEKELEEDAST